MAAGGGDQQQQAAASPEGQAGGEGINNQAPQVDPTGGKTFDASSLL